MNCTTSGKEERAGVDGWRARGVPSDALRTAGVRPVDEALRFAFSSAVSENRTRFDARLLVGVELVLGFGSCGSLIGDITLARLLECRIAMGCSFVWSILSDTKDLEVGGALQRCRGSRGCRLYFAGFIA